MITLNLISATLKKEIKFKHLFNLFKKIDYFILITIIIISVMLLTTKFVLMNRFNDVVEETTLINKNSFSYNSKVKEINNKIKTVSQIQAGFIDWTSLYSDLSANMNSDISLSYLKTDQADSSITMRGHSKTRDGLLALRSYMENSKFYSNLNFPMSNLLDKTDIDFEISAKLNTDSLK